MNINAPQDDTPVGHMPISFINRWITSQSELYYVAAEMDYSNNRSVRILLHAAATIDKNSLENLCDEMARKLPGQYWKRTHQDRLCDIPVFIVTVINPNAKISG